jgi:hypothetical protein
MSIARFKTSQTVEDTVAVLMLSKELGELGKPEQREFFGGTHNSGWFYLFANESSHPGVIMECVMSPAGDSIVALYKTEPWFASPGELARAREICVRALSEKVGLSIEAMGIEDEARGRTLDPGELSFAQLLDMLNERGEVFSGAVTDSHAQVMPKKS